MAKAVAQSLRSSALCAVFFFFSPRLQDTRRRLRHPLLN